MGIYNFHTIKNEFNRQFVLKWTPHWHVLSPSYFLQVRNIANCTLSKTRVAPFV